MKKKTQTAQKRIVIPTKVFTKSITFTELVFSPLRKCGMNDTHLKSLSSGIRPSELLQPTILRHQKLCIAAITSLDTIWRYHRVLMRPSQIGPHQVTYDAVAQLVNI